MTVQLYLIKPDYDEANDDRRLFDELERIDAEEFYRKVYQSNSGALYFAQCSHPQETWLPLLEKCYAKAHGDFAAINGGFGGEGIEDLTGGITSEIFTTDILDKERFWKELRNVNKDFFFSCATGVWSRESQLADREGIFERHSYSVQAADEVDGKRFVRLKNPWGKGEWRGAWSDGSKEWTSEWLSKLKHDFGDDGHFLMEYKDLLRKFQSFERTRLFGGNWKVARIWTTLNIPWMATYHDHYFSFQIAHSGRVVIALAQLDDRYFRGLEGQYFFRLSFRVHKAGKEDYIVRSQTHLRLQRSVSVELDLEQGEYDVRVKVDAHRLLDRLSVEEVIRRNAKTNKDKLACIGLAYDLAHSKGRAFRTVEETTATEAHAKEMYAGIMQRMKHKLIEEKRLEYYLKLKQFERDRARRLKKQVRLRQKKAAKVRRPRRLEHCGSNRIDAMNATRHDSVYASVEQSVAIEDFPERMQDAAAQEHDQAFHDTKTDFDARATNTQHIENLYGQDLYIRNEETDDDESFDSMSVYSDHELEIRANAALIRQVEAAEKSDRATGTLEEPDEFEIDPWNAVAVIGLRVFCLPSCRQETDKNVIKLRVVRSSSHIKNEGLKPAGPDWKTQGLDVDDNSKDATLTGGLADRKKSIISDGV